VFPSASKYTADALVGRPSRELFEKGDDLLVVVICRYSSEDGVNAGVGPLRPMQGPAIESPHEDSLKRRSSMDLRVSVLLDRWGVPAQMGSF
jgi:hypothetical protein